MIAYVRQLLDFVHSLPLHHVALCFAVFGLLQAVIPVFPGDILLFIGAGVWTGGIELDFLPILFSYWVGTTAASLGLTEIGRFFGDYLLSRRWLRRVFPEDRQQRAAGWLKKKGVMTILAAKFILGMNLPILLLCGIMQTPRQRVYPAVVLTTLLHNSLFYGLGSIVGLNWESFRSFLTEYELLTALILAVAIALSFRIRTKASDSERQSKD